MIDLSPVLALLSWLAEAAVWLGGIGLVLVALAVCGRNFFADFDDDDPWCCICPLPDMDAMGVCRNDGCKRKVLL